MPADKVTTRSLASQRQREIAELVQARGSARVRSLARQFGVSDMTIRRDLDRLDARGLVAKVHGGATAPVHRSADEPGFAAKSHRNTSEKSAIAVECATFATAGSAVGITGGTTTVAIARELLTVDRLTVVTNSLAVAHVFHESERSDAHVVLTGGVRTPSDALVGPVPVAVLASFNLDVVFMGVHGMHASAGFTTPNLLEADTNRAFMRAASDLVVAADHTKWGLTGLTTMATLDEADIVVSDGRLDQAARDHFDSLDPRLIIAASTPRLSALHSPH